MSRTFRTLLAALSLAVSPCLLATSGRAQQNGDVSNGQNNQPTAGEVQSREGAAGVAPSPDARKGQAATVDDTYRKLLDAERRDGITNAPADPNAPITTKPAAAPH